METSKEKLLLKFEGRDVNNGTIDVKQLAPSLLALSGLLDEINKIENPKEKLTLEISETKKGSFDVHLLIGIVGSGYIMKEIIKIYPNIRQIVLDVFAIRKHLKGKKANNIVEKEDIVELTNYENTPFRVQKNAYFLAKQETVAQALEYFVESSTFEDGIDNTCLANPDKMDEAIDINKLTAPYYSKPEVEELEEAIISEEETELYLSIHASVFDKKSKWKLKDINGAINFYDIEDEEFVNQYMNGDISLNVDDTMRCLVSFTVFHDSNGKPKAKDHKVIKVMKYIPSPKQMSIQF